MACVYEEVDTVLQKSGSG